MPPYIYRAATLVALISIAGCGGSSGSIDRGSGLLDDAGGAINGPHAGTLFLGAENEGWALDLTTGNATRIPGVRWARGEPVDDSSIKQEYRLAFGFDAAPTPLTGEEFVVAVDNCEPEGSAETTGITRYYCVALHEANGCLIALRQIRGSARGSSVALSYGGDFIALVTNGRELTLFDRTLQTISQTRLDSQLWQLTWLPDDRLLVSSNHTVWLSGYADTTALPVIEFDEGHSPDIGEIAASPDGRRIALIYGGELYVATIGESTLRHVPIVETVSALNARNVTWSPDGDFLLVTLHGTGLTWADSIGRPQQGGGQNVFINNATLIMPADFGLPGADGNAVGNLRALRGKGEVMTFGRSNAEASIQELALDSVVWLR